MDTDRHISDYRAAWRRITQGSCSRLSDGQPTNARALAKLAEPPKRSAGRRLGCLNVRGGGHNKRKYTPVQAAVFGVFGKARPARG